MQTLQVSPDEVMVRMYTDQLKENGDDETSAMSAKLAFWHSLRPGENFDYLTEEGQILTVPRDEIDLAIARAGYIVTSPAHARTIVADTGKHFWEIAFYWRSLVGELVDMPKPNLIFVTESGKYLVDGDEYEKSLAE